MKLLIVDDSKIIRDRICSRLKGVDGITEILTAENASSAWEIILDKRPEKMILDIHLHGESGIDLLRWLRVSGISEYVIVFTNFPYPESERTCRELGVRHFLNKMTDLEKMAGILSGETL
jgi:DNA-binding NarL/FixJ family response regulator